MLRRRAALYVHAFLKADMDAPNQTIDVQK